MERGDLKIDRAEALRYAGHRGSAPEGALGLLLDRCAERVLELAAPRMVYRQFPIEPGPPVSLKDTRLTLEGKAIGALLGSSYACMIMAVTLGSAVEQEIRKAQVTDMTRALFLDACASAAVESACERAEAEIRTSLGGPPPYFTRRFSPGYGDLPLTLQRPLLECLDAGRRAGLYVSEGGILTPRKSVTAIIGLMERPPHGTNGEGAGSCQSCAMKDQCVYRKEGASCER